jgi:transposase
MEKTDSRTLTVEALNERRRMAVKMRLAGKSHAEVSRITGLTRATTIKAVNCYREGGMKAVDVGRGGRQEGEGRKLTREQEIAIQALIYDHTPDQLKLGFALWTRSAVAELIEQKFGICLPVRTVGNYLKRWGFTPQKPMRKAYEQRPEAVKAWLEEEYPLIKARAKTEDVEIFWGDETGLRTDDVRGRSYSPKGQTPVVRVHQGKRENVSVISAVTNRGKVLWMVLKHALNTELFLDFLERLIKDAKRKVFLIVDNLKVHHAKVVQAWLEGHRDQIELFYLPSYSPELNPDEGLNANLKAAMRHQPPRKTKKTLQAATEEHLRLLEESPDRVKAFFQNEPVKYAAAA